MHAIHKLNSRQVEALIRTAADGRWGDGAGLYLQIRFGTPSWVFRYYVDGQEKWSGLGSARFISLLDARRGAVQNRNLRHNGQDHRVERKQRHQAADRQAVTFANVVERFVTAKAAQYNDVAKWRAPLTNHAIPQLGKLPVSMIDTNEVISVLTPIWQSSIGEHVRQRIEAVLNFATASKLRTGDNPAVWKGNLKDLLPPRQVSKHQAALAIDELPAFMSDLRALKGDVRARAFEFQILTAARPDEAMGADWSEIDLVTSTWTIPAERMKTGVAHRVPLSDRAVELLRGQGSPKKSGIVFPSVKKGIQLRKNSFLDVIKELGREVTAHGFRSTFADWSATRTKYPRDLSQKALSHVVGNVVERAYQRTDLFDKRVPLMSDWANFCSAQLGGDNVVSLSAAA